MTFSGPLEPKLIADAFVASENVGEGGARPVFGCLLTFEGTERDRRERGLCMACWDGMCKVCVLRNPVKLLGVVVDVAYQPLTYIARRGA